MPGGGPFNLGRGQMTDDSELAMCLMWGLIEAVKAKKNEDKHAVFSNQSIAHYYGEWMRSDPFDIGTTTSGGLSPLEDYMDHRFSKNQALQVNM